MAQAKPVYGGYEMSFRGCHITMESVMGTKPLNPSQMTKRIWSYIRRERLFAKAAAQRVTPRSRATRGTHMSSGKGRPLLVPNRGAEVVLRLR